MTRAGRDQTVIDEIGRRLREARQARGWSRESAALRSGVTAVALGSYERGDRVITVPVLLILAEAYGTSPAVLLPGSGAVDPRQLVDAARKARDEADRVLAAFGAGDGR